MNTAKLLHQLGEISVCQIVDGVGRSLAVDTNIRPLDTSFRVCAPAYTVQCPADDNLTLHHALHAAAPGEVLVVTGSGGDKTALWGELMSVSAQCRGLSGTMIDGPARDPIEIAALKYPVFARSIRPRRASKECYGRIGGRIQFGDLTVDCGDIVVGDCNGIVSFPTEMLAAVVEQALVVVQKEAELKEMLRGGRTYFEIAGLSSLVPSELDSTRGR